MDQGEKPLLSLVPPSARCLCVTGISLSPSQRCHHHPSPPMPPRQGFHSPVMEEETPHLYWTHQCFRTATPETPPSFLTGLVRAG